MEVASSRTKIQNLDLSRGGNFSAVIIVSNLCVIQVTMLVETQRQAITF